MEERFSNNKWPTFNRVISIDTKMMYIYIYVSWKIWFEWAGESIYQTQNNSYINSPLQLIIRAASNDPFNAAFENR